MSENVWEELVQTYLATNRAMLVGPQYEITDEHGWRMCPDFLAIDFQKRQIWIVEVSAGSDTSKIQRKARQFKAEIVPRLRKQLANFAIVPDASQWKFGLLAFARKNVTKKLREKIEPHLDLCKVEDLESIAFSWDYWDMRRAEECAPDQKPPSTEGS